MRRDVRTLKQIDTKDPLYSTGTKTYVIMALNSDSEVSFVIRGCFEASEVNWRPVWPQIPTKRVLPAVKQAGQWIINRCPVI